MGRGPTSRIFARDAGANTHPAKYPAYAAVHSADLSFDPAQPRTPTMPGVQHFAPPREVSCLPRRSHPPLGTRIHVRQVRVGAHDWTRIPEPRREPHPTGQRDHPTACNLVATLHLLMSTSHINRM